MASQSLEAKQGNAQRDGCVYHANGAGEKGLFINFRKTIHFKTI